MLGKSLIALGLVAILAGLGLVFKDRMPGIQRLGRLPGDFFFQGENLKIYFPLATSVLVSVVFSLLFWLFRSRQ